MYRAKVLCICLLLVAFLFPAGSVAGSRSQWWTHYLEKLDMYKQQILDGNGVSKDVLALLDKEISEGKKILSLVDNGGIKQKKASRQYDPQHLHDDILAIIKPYFMLDYLDSLLYELAGSNALDNAQKAVKHEIRRMTTGKLGRSFPFIERKLVSDYITPRQHKTIALEMALAHYSKNLDNCIRKVADKVLFLTEPELKNKSYQPDQSAFNSIVYDAYISIPLEEKIVLLKGSGPIIQDLWSWNNIAVPVNRELDQYKAIYNWMKHLSTLTGEEIVLYNSDEVKLEKTLFAYLKKSCRYELSTRQQKYFLHKNDFSVSVPADFDMKNAIDEIDKKRKQLLKTVYRINHDTVPATVSKTFNSICAKYTAPINKHYRKEDTRLKLFHKQQEEAGSAEIIENEELFYREYKKHNTKYAMLKFYNQRAIEFVIWSCNKFVKDYTYIVDTSRSREQKTSQYLSVLERIVDGIQAIDISHCDRKKYHTILTTKGHVKKIMKYLSYTNSNEQPYLNVLSARQLNTVKQNKQKVQKNIVVSTTGINQGYHAFIKRYRSFHRQKRKNELNVQDDIAQLEVNMLYNMILKYTEYFETLTYDEQVFRLYSETFNDYFARVNKGEISSELARLMNSDSLFSGVRGFDSARLTEERRTKQFLKNYIRVSLARLKALLRHYKNKRVPLVNRPAHDQFSRVLTVIGKHFTVKVAQWTMDEFNYQHVDKKVTRYLQILGQKKQARADRTGVQNNRYIREDINGLSLSLKMPGGWYRERLFVRDKEFGSVAVYHSADNAYSLSVYTIPKKQEKRSEVAKKIMTKAAGPYVQKKWGKAAGREYFWLLSRDGKQNVCESYTLEKQGYHVVLLGKTSKIKYNFYKDKLHNLIQTLIF